MKTKAIFSRILHFIWNMILIWNPPSELWRQGMFSPIAFNVGELLLPWVVVVVAVLSECALDS